MNRHYEAMSFAAITVDAASPVLAQSGQLGARIKVEAGVDDWKDYNDLTTNPFETKITSDGSPLEF